MAKNSPIFEATGRLFGRERIRELNNVIKAAGLSISPEGLAGFYVLLSVVLSFILSYTSLAYYPIRASIYKFNLFLLKPLVVNSSVYIPIFTAFLSIAIVFGSIAVIFYVILLMMADNRRNKIDQVLPDFLTLAAANVRAGMTIDQALWYAAKPEFGLLSTEFEIVAKQTFGGMAFEQALDGLANRINSRNMRRTVSLIKQGMASGGEIAEILERTSEDTRNMQVIRKEIAASLLMYIIFIVFAAGIGAPFLFAVASKLITILEDVFSQIPATADVPASMSSSFIQPSPPIVTSEEFFLFVLASSAITAFFSSIMMGVIQKGTKREGIKYLPFIVIASVVIFTIISQLLDNFLKGMGGF
jgi:flagellar protein FlaJ